MSRNHTESVSEIDYGIHWTLHWERPVLVLSSALLATCLILFSIAAINEVCPERCQDEQNREEKGISRTIGQDTAATLPKSKREVDEKSPPKATVGTSASNITDEPEKRRSNDISITFTRDTSRETKQQGRSDAFGLNGPSDEIAAKGRK